MNKSLEQLFKEAMSALNSLNECRTKDYNGLAGYLREIEDTAQEMRECTEDSIEEE